MLDVLAALPSESVDSIVTDPPYGLTNNKKGGTGTASLNLDSPAGRSRVTTGGFMGCEWDAVVPGPTFWRSCLRVAKPGAYLVAFGGPRTAHRLACAIEDAGWEIRDCLMWLYGTGFPKSHNLRDEWAGWGTALKPAWEPIYLCRKSFKRSVAGNVLEHRTGALNIDGCRIASGADHAAKCASVVGLDSGRSDCVYGEWTGSRTDSHSPLGRWPANLLLDEEAAALLDAQTGELQGRGNVTPTKRPAYAASSYQAPMGYGGVELSRGDIGGASRFFYTAKASRTEREAGLDRFEPRIVNDGRDTPIDNPYQRGDTLRKNTHPTVKPLALMRWLVRLVTPPNGLVLDPFAGSGTTGIAAVLERFRFLGVERLSEYAELARARIASVDPSTGEPPT